MAFVAGLPAALLAIQGPLWQDLDVAAAVAQPLSAPVLVLAGIAGGWLLWAWLIIVTVLDVAAALTD